uniref:Helitron helicase-like domain-containing protein n=1 Tax=Ditylenchus dipsaci TaxID=166011 RepID=A0A915E5Z2_9BILA
MAFASLSVRQYQYHLPGPYCFRISGQIYRNFNTAALPDEDEQAKGGQLFFIDTHEALGIRQSKLKCDPKDTEMIHNYLLQNNPYAKAYVMMKDEMNEQERIGLETGQEAKQIQLLFNLKTTADQRRYNLPQTNEVAAVFVPTSDGNVPAAHITVHERGKEVKNLQHIDPNVEPMLYPLLRPNGEQGWNVNMKTKSGKKLTQCDYINFHNQYRRDKVLPNQYEFNPLHYADKLTHQWYVERWCCVEAERLLFIRLNQNKIKATSYSGLQDYLNNTKEQLGASIGRQIVLPSTYTGGPRYMLNGYNDAMCICSEFGIPDLFITMTCDPTHPDILKNIPSGDKPNNHPGICNRVFRQHCEKVLEVLNCKDKKKGGIFGRMTAFCYTIEFQKRGLPHMHLLLTVDEEGKKYLRDNVDEVLSARVCLCGDENCFINARMIHGPCGLENPKCPCMKSRLCPDCNSKPKRDRPADCEDCAGMEKYCSKGFPQPFSEKTDLSGHGYAKLKAPIGESVKVGNRTIDNSMVVPHSPIW